MRLCRLLSLLNRTTQNIFRLLAVCCVSLVFWAGHAKISPGGGFTISEEPFVLAKGDSDTLAFPFKDNSYSPFLNNKSGGVYLNNPSNITSEVKYDPSNGTYNIQQKLGDSLNYRATTPMDFEQYKDYSASESLRKYWKEKTDTEMQLKKEDKSGWRPSLKVDNKAFETIFGSNTIDIRPSGSAELIFGFNTSRTDNPAIPERQRRVTTFDFNEKIQLNVIGNIGDKLKLTTNYNTEATFDFENQMKLEYTGHEDEIIQKIEAGNVTLPLQGSLITGSQSLFGVKTALKFGKLTVTSVYSQQRGKKSEITVEGGAQVSNYELKADNYEANRHFFLGHFFRDLYEEAVGSPPLLNTSVNVTRIEVWVTNTNVAVDNTRNIIAFQDLGERNPARTFNNTNVSNNPGAFFTADNNANNLYQNMSANQAVRGFTSATATLSSLGYEQRTDYQRIELARRLNESEYTLQPQLGYISLNTQINQNQVLAVAYQYTYRGQTYQVGEFSTDGIQGINALYLKMLKSTELNTTIPMWDLMMKNVYSIGAYQVKREGFKLDIWYLDQETGVYIPFIPEGPVDGVPLIQVFGLDKLNANNAATPDGVFDYISSPQITINESNGRVYFPVLEPFGSDLREALGTAELGEKYAFDSLYTNTQPNAQVKFPSQNRFVIRGQYESSSSSEISLNAFNIPQGSVTVTAGGQQLQENVDYTVDYTLGRVKIINTGILESGTPINISLESNALFNIQTKTLFASRFDYKFNDDFTVGGTIMNLTERPLTQKINIGDEPMSNTQLGFDWNYKTESQFLTNLVDKIPLIDTKEKSSINFTGEYATLIPGHSRAIGKDGTAYIDDFEGSQSAIDIRAFSTWVLASTPQGQSDLFPEGRSFNDLAFGFNRAKLAWYVIDPLFFRNNNLTPDHINGDPQQSNHFMRQVFEQEVFPNRQLPNGQPNNIPVFDLAFYPNERGPYNYDVDGFNENGEKFGHGLNADGSLKNPRERWGGIMRRIETNDFEAANVEFIQFWLMDPYAESGEPGFPDNAMSGDLYFNIGNISEDILYDGFKTFENGLPVTATAAADLTPDTLSAWGRVPLTQAVVNAFSNDPDARILQDVGLDGLDDAREREFFQVPYLDKFAAAGLSGSVAEQNAQADPSADNYHYFRGDDYDAAQVNILERYIQYNGLEGNSPTAEQSQSLNGDGYPTTASTLPNVEDINRDNTLDDVESYYQYKVSIDRSDVNPQNVGNNFITDVLQTTVTTRDGNKRPVTWYQFKIPIRDPERVVGNISDFRSIRFMRIFMKGFDQPVYLRFARLELVRGEWRRFLGDLDSPTEFIDEEPNTTFTVAAVNIEENGKKTPVNYTLPPGIEREINIGTTNLQQLNEQSLSMTVCNLEDGIAKAAYRNVDFDVRSYKKLKMYVHLESADQANPVEDGDLRAFIRLGTDFVENYYEFEVPLAVTPPGTYNAGSDAGREQVWPYTNNFEVVFERLQRAKSERNRALFSGDPNVSLQKPYAVRDGKNTIYIVGNPNLSTLKTIMLGVRNPPQEFGSTSDDGLAKCAELWFNELRLTDFDQESGWAAISRVTARLADFATVSLAGSISTPGWGSIEKKVSERQRETIKSFDASTTIELGKFLPEKAGLKVPMYLGYSETVSNPQFDPLNPDIFFNEQLETLDPNEREQFKKKSQSFTKRRSINFTNVRKERTSGSGREPRFYDVENLSVTYAYSEQFRRDINTEFNSSKDYRGGLSYNFSPKSKNYKPFSRAKLFRKSKYLRAIRDFNFYTVPKQFSFRTDINRTYTESKARNNTPGFVFEPQIFVDKNFTWNRTYDLQYDLSKSLKFDFSASNNALIDEAPGTRINRNIGDSLEVAYYEQFRDTVMQSIREFGTTTNYRHQTNLSYTLPFSKFPLTSWITSTARYSASYTWNMAPFAADSLGNTIQNTNQFQLNGTFNMTSLYNKVGYFKKINQKARRGGRGRPVARQPDKSKKDDESSDEEDDKKKKKDKKDKKFTTAEQVARVLMSVKNVSVTYSQNNGLNLPGYQPRTQILGMDPQFDAPGVGFIFGQQDNFGEDRLDYIRYAGERGWLVRESNLNTPYSRTFTENLNIRASIEPVSDLRIELNATRSSSRNNSEFFRWNDTTAEYLTESPLETGSYSVSIMTWQTAFIPDQKITDLDPENGDRHTSSTFEKFIENRQTISERLSARNSASSADHENDAGFKEGYGGISQDVLIPAFVAAYTGNSASLVGLDAFIDIPQPNWRVTYNGLSKIEFLKKYFKSVTLNHSYRSTYNVSNYTSNLLYSDSDGDGFPDGETDINGDYIPEFQISAITISEQFSPLINVDMQWQNSLFTRVEVKKDRNLSMSFANAQLTEVRGTEFVIGAGYTISKLKLPFDLRGKPITSDLKLRTDVAFRNNRTVIRQVVGPTPDQETAGQGITTIKVTADYQVSKQLNLRLFYDRIVTRPVTTLSFPTANTNAGLSIRFTLSS